MRILNKKYLHHQHDLYRVCIDFKRAFDGARYEARWTTRRKYNINASIIQAVEKYIQQEKRTVVFNGSTEGWFRTTVGLRQGCLFSPTLFNIIPERMTRDALIVESSLKVKSMQKPGTEAIRTQIKPSKPNWETTKITNSHNTKRTYGQPRTTAELPLGTVSNEFGGLQHVLRRQPRLLFLSGTKH